ncbi:MAG: glycerate kinase [Propionibacteriaceae bacterium]|jgi:glycerate kinase|nr:glycerate kinase [Propionibacteriaceae bacterium]
MTKFVLAPDSFKESMSASVAAQAMAAGIRDVLPGAECVLVPMADGGEGTMDAIVDALGGQRVKVKVSDPLGNPHIAEYGLVENGEEVLAVIEMAKASGLELVRAEDRDPARTTSVGTGQLISDALGRGARHLIIGIGGSATNDAGAGMMQALGVKFLDEEGNDLVGGGALEELERVDISGLDPRLAECNIEVACDVDNPLLGIKGATRVFGPQKGATAGQLVQLEEALNRWADVVETAVGKRVRDVPGAGAAGGIGAALLAFTPGKLRSGAEIVIDAVGLKDKVSGADYVFTGEGSIDKQTLSGKTPYAVAKAATAAGVPTVMFAGFVDLYDYEFADADVLAIVPILRKLTSLEEALQDGDANLTYAARTVARLLASYKTPGFLG